jgi:plasmid stabilization system protein ParE
VSRFTIGVLPQAEAEIREAFVWYAERSAIAADAFRTEVLSAIDKLADSADMWPADEENLRRYVLRHFPFTVHYELNGLDVIVLAVAHQRRRPGYWHDR